MITARNNAGKQASIDVSDLLAEYELQMLVNRTAVFEAAINAPQGFALGVYELMPALNQANETAALNAFRKSARIIEREFKQTAKDAADEVDSKVKRLMRQGYELPTMERFDSTATATAVAATTLASIFTTITASKQTVLQQALSIATRITGTGDEIPQQLARANKIAAQDGAKVILTRGEFEVASYGEGIVLNDGMLAYRQSQGQAQAQAGINLVQISAHPSSCPLCAPWQTAILVNDSFASSGGNSKYQLLSTAINEGLFHYNCRHEMTEFIEGLSDPTLYNYDKASNKETAARYAIEQQQRGNERHIREWRRVYETATDPRTEEAARLKVAEWQARQRALGAIAKQEKIPFYRQYHREQIGGKTQPDNTLVKLGKRWAA